MRAVELLRGVPVLAGLPGESLERVAGQVNDVRVPAGEWIVREGEAAESAFIVSSGAIEVLVEGPPEVLVRVLRRGDVVGELALLREGTRSASVRARRDAELLELGRAAFETLIREASGFALALARAMAAQLATSRAPVVAARPPRTLTVVGLDVAAPTAEVAEGLARALSKHGSVASLHAGGLGAIDQAERDADRVVLCGTTAPDEEWTELCVREAELVVGVTSGTPDRAWLARAAALRGCELLVLGPGAADGLAELEPRALQVVVEPQRHQSAIQATARRLAGRSLGVVLSGGGARALAHLGVLEELRAAGLEFDRIAGVSMGSLVAATAAAGFTNEDMYAAFERAFVAERRNPIHDFVLPAYSVLRGARARSVLRETFGERRIEELPLRFFCLSCDLVARERVVHRTGPVVDAVYPSFAIPGVFPPVATGDGRLLVDGGVLDNLPVASMARTGEGPVIAVDVTGRVGQLKRARRPRVVRLARLIRHALTASEGEVPLLAETILRTVTVGSTDTVAEARAHADLVIAPRVDGVGLMEWKALGRVRELGRRAAREALAADPDLSSHLGI